MDRRAAEVAVSTLYNLKPTPGADEHSSPSPTNGEVLVPTLPVPEPAVISPMLSPSHSKRRSSAAAAPPAKRTSIPASPMSPAVMANFSMSDIAERQPFRQECMRIVTTFLQPGAAKELTLDAIVRDTCIKKFATNTHPDTVSPNFWNNSSRSRRSRTVCANIRRSIPPPSKHQPSQIPGSRIYQHQFTQTNPLVCNGFDFFDNRHNYCCLSD